jgi:hypothetical protein
VTALHRSVTRFDPRTRERLDDLADQASSVLRHQVPRTAVIRAAVTFWLARSESADRAQIIEAIRVALVPRGKKAKR